MLTRLVDGQPKSISSRTGRLPGHHASPSCNSEVPLGFVQPSEHGREAAHPAGRRRSIVAERCARTWNWITVVIVDATSGGGHEDVLLSDAAREGPVHEILVSDPDFKTGERNGRDALKRLALDDDVVVGVDERRLRADARRPGRIAGADGHTTPRLVMRLCCHT